MHRDGCISAVAVQRRRCTEEDSRRESADSRYRSVAAVRQRQQERKQRGEVWIGFVTYAGRRSNVDCSWALRCLVALAEVLATNWWPDECDVLGAETSNEGQFHYRQDVLVAVLLFTKTWERLGTNRATKRRCIGERHAQVWECAVGEIEMRIWVVELDAAGETAVPWELKQDEVANTIPTIGSNLESS